MSTIDDKVLQEANHLAQRPGKFGFVGYQANLNRKPGDWDYSVVNPGLNSGVPNNTSSTPRLNSSMEQVNLKNPQSGTSGYDQFDLTDSTLQDMTVTDSSGILLGRAQNSNQINGSPAVPKISHSSYSSSLEHNHNTGAQSVKGLGSFSSAVGNMGQSAQTKAQNVQSAHLSEIHGAVQPSLSAFTADAVMDSVGSVAPAYTSSTASDSQRKTKSSNKKAPRKRRFF